MKNTTPPKFPISIIWFCRVAVGLLFIFSGLIKANDPLGFSYKLEEYFEVFHMMWLSGFALYFAIFLCALEMILGFALLVGWRAVQVTWGLLLLIIFFGFLTFYSAYFKVVQTCGCFGDAIPLTPWQSFSKDMALLLLVLVLFVDKQFIKPILKPEAGRMAFIVAVIFSFGVSIYTYNFLPVLDFLPYKVGSNLPDEMKTPPDAKPDEYEITYHLKNKATGAEKSMNSNYYTKSGIWKDSNWEIKGTPESHLVKKGFTPKIQDLLVQDATGNNYTQELLSSPFYSVWIVADNLDHTNVDAIGRLNALALNLQQNFNIRTILITSTAPSSATEFAKVNHFAPEIFYCDGVPLKEMVRSNPGIILIKNGVVINKWHYHNIPTYDVLVNTYLRK